MTNETLVKLIKKIQSSNSISKENFEQLNKIFKNPPSQLYKKIVQIIFLILKFLKQRSTNSRSKQLITKNLKRLIVTELMQKLIVYDNSIIFEIIEVTFCLGEKESLQLVKSINLFIRFILLNHYNYDQELILKILKSYHSKIQKLIGEFDRVITYIENYAHFYNGSFENLPLKYSISVQIGIIDHINDLIQSSQTYSNYLLELFKKILRFVIKLNIQKFQKIMLPKYFNNFLLFAHGSIYFIGFIYQDPKFRQLTNAFLQITNNGEKIFPILIQCIRAAPISIPQFKMDAFSNFKKILLFFPNKLKNSFEKITRDSFFQMKSLLIFSKSRMNQIYYYWISAVKDFLQIPNISLDQSTYLVLIENHMNCLFNSQLRKNYQITILNNIIILFKRMNA